MPNESAILGNTTFTRCKSLVARPLAINFSDGGGSQRIDPKSEFLVDEKRLKNDPLAASQLDHYIQNRRVRVIEKGVTF